MTRWHVYMVRTREGTLYTGITLDVDRRMTEHRSGGGKGARYLRGRGPIELAFQRPIGERTLALQAEHRLKRMPKARKEAIVKTNPGTRRLLTMLSL
jgi:putative endonuclease